LRYVFQCFPTETKLQDLQSAILDQYSVPDDYGYEFDGEIPEELGYWSTQFDDDETYWNYKNLSVNISTYKNKISFIREKAEITTDALTKKSLIFSAFVITETYIKSKIVSNLPNVDTAIKVPLYRAIVEQSINKDLRESSGRQRLYNRMFKSDNLILLPIPNVALRNALAHDIESPSIDEDKISYFDEHADKNRFS
jgi:ribosomal protein S26